MARITKSLIRQYFGNDVKIRKRFFGGFNVTTPTGGDVDIDKKKITTNAGGDDVYAAVTLLGAHLWGGITATGGDEHILAILAHGEALGVGVTPKVKQSGGGCLRFFVVFWVFVIVLGITAAMAKPNERPGAFVVAGLVSGWVWHLLKKAQTRAEQRHAQSLRFQYPRIYGNGRKAARADAQRQGWL